MPSNFFDIINKNITVISWSVNIVIISALIITAAILGKGLRKLDIRQFVFLSILAAMASALRAILPIPNIKPTSFIIIIAGTLFGPAAGFYLGIVITVLSSLLTEFGPYVPWQMLCWGMMGLTASFFKDKNRWLVAFYGFAWGFIYGWIMDLWWPLSGIITITKETILIGFAASFYFDLMHALTNFVLLILFPQNLWEILLNKLITIGDKSISKR